jgi:hypothetical protein
MTLTATPNPNGKRNARRTMATGRRIEPHDATGDCTGN